MWAKVLACVLAAAAVVGIGVYAALPPGTGTCDKCGTKQVSTDCCPDGGCCPLGACCAQPQATSVNTDALAACTGGMTVTAEPAKANSCPVGACCGD